MQPVHVVLHWAAREGLVSECTVRESGRAALFIATPTTTGEIDARVNPRCLAHEGQQSLRRGCNIQPPALGVVEGRAVCHGGTDHEARRDHVGTGERGN